MSPGLLSRRVTPAGEPAEVGNSRTRHPQIRTGTLVAHWCCLSEVWRETYAGHLSPGQTGRPDVGHIPDLVGNPAQQGWVATLGERLVGYASVTANCVDQIWVSAGMRRRGIGSGLLARAIEGIRERGFAFAQAGCEDFNRPARQFLEAKGWRLIDTQTQPLGGGRSCNALVFSRPLT
jgi:GNAT superfamily N-acetyltransferase